MGLEVFGQGFDCDIEVWYGADLFGGGLIVTLTCGESRGVVFGDRFIVTLRLAWG